jgi:hypothetical protein
MLSDTMLRVVFFIIIMLIVNMLCAIMLNVVILIVIMNYTECHSAHWLYYIFTVLF